MNLKKIRRLRRAKATRCQIREHGATRLCVHRTPRHIYAQVIEPGSNKVIAQASTLEQTLRDRKTGNISAAVEVGELIAKRALEIGIKKVAFDRSGFKYHGRVKALADSARASGLEF